jgi:hypothetical protein
MRLAAPRLAVLAAILISSTVYAAPARVAPGLRAQAEQRGQTTVFVKLRTPRLPRRAALKERCDAVAAGQDRALASVRRADIHVERRFESIAAITASVSAEGLAALAANPEVVSIDAMARGSGALADSLPLMRGDFVHRRGLEGAGAVVAVLDSGVEVTHPDVAGRVVAQQCFCAPNCCPNGSEIQSGAGSAVTQQPHGIHVTGIIGSAGIISAPGTAPAVRVVSVKVLDEENRGFLADWVAGLDWIILSRPDVQAVNMSLVSDAIFAGFCDQPEDPNDLTGDIAAFAEAFATLRERDVLVFAATGNVGESNRIAAPGCIEDAVAVAGVDLNGRLWRGTNISSATDLLAPAVSVESDGVGGSLLSLTGTSMSTAFATGTAALLLAMNPDIGADDLESIMERTGVPVSNRNGTQQFPRIDALQAVNEAWRVTQPLLGGGSRRTDCLAAWDFAAAAATRPRPVAGAECQDGDPACDADATPGRCGFDFRVCFNASDGRLPECDTGSPIQTYGLGTPSPRGDAIDVSNAAALQSILPPAPIGSTNVCTDAVRFTVPVGSKSIRFAARAADGRTDDDKLRLTCRAAQ